MARTVLDAFQLPTESLLKVSEQSEVRDTLVNGCQPRPACECKGFVRITVGTDLDGAGNT